MIRTVNNHWAETGGANGNPRIKSQLGFDESDVFFSHAAASKARRFCGV
jgi:hypothetical protein